MTTTAVRKQPTGIRLAAGRASWRFRLATAAHRLQPTFLIIGAQKSGTTSLHRYLSKNPAVLLASPKEVRYFHRNHERGDRWYRAQFPLRAHARLTEFTVGSKPAIGEASPIYLFDPRAPGRVHAFDPSMKLIALLRDPVDRAYSHFHMQLRWGYETVSFEEHPNRHEKIVSVAAESPFRFPRESIAAALDRAKTDREGFHGPRIQLEAPDMPDMGLAMERLESGASTRRQRSTADHVFAVVEGSGETTIKGERFAWKAGDTVVVPKWNKYEHRATRDSVLFDLSNEPLIRFTKCYRFEAD